jgi:hypothetical protein
MATIKSYTLFHNYNLKLLFQEKVHFNIANQVIFISSNLDIVHTVNIVRVSTLVFTIMIYLPKFSYSITICYLGYSVMKDRYMDCSMVIRGAVVGNRILTNILRSSSLPIF